MKPTKSVEIKAQIERIEERIASDQKWLADLEQELAVVSQQEQERRAYINSKEIVQTIESSTNKSVDMSTIKRWADKGYLGHVYDEREKFFALDVGSGKQRNIYQRSTVLRFLLDRQYIHPAFEILDLVKIRTNSGSSVATVVNVNLGTNGFEYTLQLENDARIVADVPEEDIEAIGGKAY